MKSNTVSLSFFADDLKSSLSDRLRRIEGQIRGIDRMLQDNQPCPKVLQQLSATSAALHGVSTLVLRNYLESCVAAAIESGDKHRKAAVFDELMNVVRKFGQ